MKRVRYAIGAVGLTPALGLMLPAVTAAPGATHPPKKPFKTARLPRHAAPLVVCRSRSHAYASTTGPLSGQTAFSGVCVHFQGASLRKAQTGLTERVRFYSGGGRLESTKWNAGNIDSNNTYFSSSPNSFARKVCEALVANGNHADVKYGPVCERA